MNYDNFISGITPNPPKPKTKLDLVNEKFKELKEEYKFPNEYDDIVFIFLANDIANANSFEDLPMYNVSKLFEGE